MLRSGSVWRLYAGVQLLGDLVVEDANFPWVYARLAPLDAFERVRPLFDEEHRLLEGVDGHVEEWEAAYQRVEEAVSLADPDGRRVPEFLLHIKGDQAWWRWNDEPFDESADDDD